MLAEDCTPLGREVLRGRPIEPSSPVWPTGLLTPERGRPLPLNVGRKPPAMLLLRACPNCSTTAAYIVMIRGIHEKAQAEGVEAPEKDVASSC